MQDPVIELRNADGNLIRSNDNWREAPNRADIEARGLAPQDDREAALLQTLQPGPYTAILRGKPDAPNGVALVEIFNVD
jgi:tRNA A37 threonylcarbamoyladenosine synthetase subunit TsaC/SUA5/YrdC